MINKKKKKTNSHQSGFCRSNELHSVRKKKRAKKKSDVYLNVAREVK